MIQLRVCKSRIVRSSRLRLSNLSRGIKHRLPKDLTANGITPLFLTREVLRLYRLTACPRPQAMARMARLRKNLQIKPFIDRQDTTGMIPSGNDTPDTSTTTNSSSFPSDFTSLFSKRGQNLSYQNNLSNTF